MITVNVRNNIALAQKLNEVPRGARGAATESAAKVIIGNDRTGLQHYPPVPAGSVYSRTYDLRFGWKVSAWGDGVDIKIQNNVKYAPYVQGASQTWFHAAHGWKTIWQVIDSNRAAINKAINEAVARFLKDKGLT